MATTNSISQQLLDLLATRNFHPEMLDRAGKPSNAQDAKTFTFDYVAGSGTNYGTMVIVLDSDNEMKIMYGDNLGRTMEGNDKSEFFDFLQHLNQKARTNRWTHSIADINQLKYTMQGMAAIQEGLFEGYYGTKKVSYAGEPTQARLQIVHSQPLGEGDARYRHIDRMFIETVDGERFKLGFKSLSGARAMLEHVRQGGKPYDVRGCHITETVNEIAVLSRFNRASANRILEGVTQELVTEAQAYYQSLRENLKHMASTRGYAKYFEAWHPATINEQEGVVDNIKTLFIEQSIDSRIEAALPLLAKIQQRGQEMKEADIFENWINRLTEGTWTLPETPEQLDKLKTLMTKELIVGPDATNATEQLYDLVGDDILFDRLHALADQDPRANCWNDTEVMQRLAELGVEMPQPSAPGNPAEPQTGATAPVDASVAPNPVPQQPVAEEFDGDPSPVTGAITRRIIHQHPEVLAKYGPAIVSQAIDEIADFVGDVDEIGSSDVSGYVSQVIRSLGRFSPVKDEGMYEGDNLATFEDINSIRNLADLPVVESVLTDSTGSTLDHICNRFGKEVRDFETSGEMSDDLYHALYDYYFDDMPYGTKKARDGDPYEYVADRFAQDRGLEENLIAPMAMPVTTEGAGCNMTMEGEYCPEHGLMECGMGMAESELAETFEDELNDLKRLLGEGWKSELAGGTLGGVGGTVAGSALGALAGGPVGAAVGGVIGGAAGGTGGAMLGREMSKEEQLNEIAPLLAAGARAVIPLLAKVGPKLGQMASGAGKAGAQVAGKTAAGIGRGTADVAKSAAQSAAQNAGQIGLGVGAYQAITDVADKMVGGVGEVYRDAGQAASTIAQAVGGAIDGKTIAELAGAAVKYAIPVGILLAVLYGGKKLIDQVMAEGLAGAAIGRAIAGASGGLGMAPLGVLAGHAIGDTLGSTTSNKRSPAQVKETSALQGQYGHSGKLQKFDEAEQDVLHRLRELSGMIRS